MAGGVFSSEGAPRHFPVNGWGRTGYRPMSRNAGP